MIGAATILLIARRLLDDERLAIFSEYTLEDRRTSEHRRIAASVAVTALALSERRSRALGGAGASSSVGQRASAVLGVREEGNTPAKGEG